MYGTFSEFYQSSPALAIMALLFCFLVFGVIGLLPLCGLLYLVNHLLTLPLRRNDRARFFLDLLELGLNDGHTPKAAIVGAASSRDPSLGVRFHWLAAQIEQGLSFGQTLDLVPSLLPPAIRGMLKAGEQIGDMRKVLPACRQMLGDAVSQVRGALNYVLLLAFVVTPACVLVPLLLRIKVLPAYRQVFAGMGEGTPLPALTRLVFEGNGFTTLLQALLLALVWVLLLTYLGGPRLHRWCDRVWPGLADALGWRLPWRRRRAQRNFATLLATLLDSGVPEAEAVRLAGEAADNRVIARRASLVREALAAGVKLPEAVGALDRSGEFHWRLTNALRRGGGFGRAVEGWCEALTARAFQQEQTAAQLLTTGFVLVNGLIVAFIVIGLFMAFVNLLNQMLW